MWKNINSSFDPIAFEIFGLRVHWYGICYVLALLVAFAMAHWIVKKDKLPISHNLLDSYFLWVEIGVVLGARLGYVIFYDPYTHFYLTHPLEIFNPFDSQGNFIGISGLSFHGALIGFLVASIIFSAIKKCSFWRLMDLVGISVPLGYIFGRIGNFLNQELYGRVVESGSIGEFFGVYVNGQLRHPSQLYEAVLEGLVVFLIIFFYRKRAKFVGQIGVLYLLLYSIARFIAEFWREPDSQLGFVAFDFFSMGQILSICMFIIGITLWFLLPKISKPTKATHLA